VEINSKMWGILADWIEAHEKFDLMPESMYLTGYIIDRLLDAPRASDGATTSRHLGPADRLQVGDLSSRGTRLKNFG
jgi:hypothetical protein